MKPGSSFLLAELRTGEMRTSLPLYLPTSFLPALLLSVSSLLLYPVSANAIPGSDYDYGAHPRFVCTPIPVDADPACFPPGGPGVGGSGSSGPGHHGPPGGPPTNGWWGMTEEAKATILHLRESLVQQKETILDQRETIRELTAKLTLCEGFGRGATAHDDHHGSHHGGLGGHPAYPDNGHYGNQQGHHGNGLIPDPPHYHRSHGGPVQGKGKYVTPVDVTSSPEQMERMLQALKDRLENLQQKRNTSTTYSSSLKELLQRKISTLEQQLHHPTTALSGPDHDDDDSSHSDGDDGDDGDDDDDHRKDDRDNRHPNDHDDHHDGHHDDRDRSDHHDDSRHNSDHRDDGSDDSDDHHDDIHHENEEDIDDYLPRAGYHTSGLHSSNKLEAMLNQLHLTGSNRKKMKSPDAFQIGFPMRTNYMYGKVKRTLLHEIFALTLCLWIKGGVGPGLGTPFSYSVPGQANELVLIEWGNNPMEFLIDDKAVTLPLSLSDGKWHHVCVSWSTRDGQWEAYQDGVQRGSGENLSSWHPIKPGGVFILGQEQDTLGGRFDATQSFVGEISDLQMWSHVLTTSDISSLASCSSHLSGDVIAWSEEAVELHGGVTKYPFDPCH